MDKDPKTKAPANDEAGAFIAETAGGVGSFLPAGWYGNVRRLLQPLNMPKAALDEGLDILDVSFKAVEKKAA